MLKTISKELALNLSLTMKLFIVNFRLASWFYRKGVLKEVSVVKDIATDSIVTDTLARVVKEC
ncbi:hypothetical protein [Vibrio sp. CK2-1]|uniref:hypothetical protein n=1 Tax=Vibrio sp. CK2-1 TaxID=2912249 RepID=UPI001F3384CF|nr:hypothetical protein [Vibrio sp. CK2-1]MCF7353049.1 hypothetical protein [Vibrio sp. CK2-1]